jgi:hypothetical protein
MCMGPMGLRVGPLALLTQVLWLRHYLNHDLAALMAGSGALCCPKTPHLLIDEVEACKKVVVASSFLLVRGIYFAIGCLWCMVTGTAALTCVVAVVYFQM